MNKETPKNKEDVTGEKWRFLDPENWRAPTNQELADHYKDKRKRKDYKPSVILFQKYLSPLDVYSYLQARFGEPNGFSNFLKSPTSDNLIHWDYLLVCEDSAINIMGVNRSVQVVIDKNISDDDWRLFVENFRNAYPKQARKKAEVLKGWEEWSVFVNRYAELCSEAALQHEKITEIQSCDFKMPSIPTEEGMTDKWQEEFQGRTKKFHELQQACLALKLLTPIIVEAFINLLILIMCKQEVSENKTIYDARVRESLHIKIPSLHLTCDHFEKPVDVESSEFKDFSRIMNSRNYFFHGNADPKKDKLETVYFEKNTPIYKTPGNVHDKFFDALLDMIKPAEIIADYVKAHEFIVYVVNCIKQQHREHIWYMLNNSSLGYNEKEKRFGVLFADYLASFHIPGIKTDEYLFSEK